MTSYPRIALVSILAGAGLSASLAVSAQDLSAVPSGTYTNDPTHSYMNFSYNHFGMSNPTLSFDDFTVEMNLDHEDPTRSMVIVNIDANSVVAGSEIWKEHLTGADFFDTGDNPDITFQSTSIESAGDGAFKVVGDLNIKSVSKPVTLNVAINAAMDHPFSGKPVIGLDASGSAMRSEFGMDKLVPAVSDEIQINISTELIKAE